MSLSPQSLREECLAELKNNILPYWRDKMVDHTNGGFYGRRDGFDKLDAEADKGVILNTRILWTFSLAGRRVSEEYHGLATRAHQYLIDRFIDHDEGGVYWMVDFKGNPSNTKKQIYAQAFAIYALSEYYFLSRDETSLKHARRLFDCIEQYSLDPIDNGYLEAFDRDWNLLDDLRLSEKDANEKKTMNTHLHILEAYTNLYRCWRDERLLRQLKNLIRLFIDKIITSDFHFGLFFDEQWNLRSKEISYGHDIEGSWLLYEAAIVSEDEKLIRESAGIAVRMADVAINEGLDEDGGLRNEDHNADKDWWPQAEAMVGLVNAGQISGKKEYLDTAVKVWNFIKRNIIDQKNGEWFWGISQSGEVIIHEDKAGPWKCPYHNSRAMFELDERLPRMK